MVELPANQRCGPMWALWCQPDPDPLLHAIQKVLREQVSRRC